ncbi:MAG: DivIVA domain-containing protein [Eubacteriales bacterium]|nr:DivIVA domain-containing protein [Eubacteriales bacterium]
MLTIDDINNKKFSYQMKGYNKREVDEFLDRIAIDYKAMANQNVLMQKRVGELKLALDKEKGNDVNKKDTIDEARRIMNDISASAEQKAEMIINKARAEAEEIKRNAADSTVNINNEAKGLRDQLEQFRASYRKMLEDQIEELDDNTSELMSELRRDFPEAAGSQDKVPFVKRVQQAEAELERKKAAEEAAQAAQAEADAQVKPQPAAEAQQPEEHPETKPEAKKEEPVTRNTLIYQTPTEKPYLSEPDLSEFINTDIKPREEKASEDPLSAYIELDHSKDSERDTMNETKLFSRRDWNIKE